MANVSVKLDSKEQIVVLLLNDCLMDYYFF